jgi:hypothetical protein
VVRHGRTPKWDVNDFCGSGTSKFIGSAPSSAYTSENIKGLKNAASLTQLCDSHWPQTIETQQGSELPGLQNSDYLPCKGS